MPCCADIFVDEQILCAGIRSGHPRAEAWFAGEMRRRWYRWLQKRVGIEDAADVLQQASLFIHQAIANDRVRDLSRLWSSFVGRVVMNEASGCLRRRFGTKGQHRLVSIDEIRGAQAHGADPESNAIAADRSRRLLDALDGLRAPRRAVIIAYYFGGETCTSIARRMGTRPQQVKMVLHHARTDLKAALSLGARKRLERIVSSRRGD